MPRNVSAPTTRYSTSFEFRHSINSRKSLLKGIGVGSLSQFKEYAGSLLRGHLSVGKRSAASASSKLAKTRTTFSTILFYACSIVVWGQNTALRVEPVQAEWHACPGKLVRLVHVLP